MGTPSDPQPLRADADVARFRRAMARFATGVTVVTTQVGGVDHAMTASAFTSVSLEPLLVLVCVEREARFHDAIVESGLWGVSILPSTARATADWLATRGRPLHGQLERVPTHRGVTGVALLDESLSTLECETTDAYPGGDHTIVVGRVVSVEISDHAGDALVYYRGRYDSLA